jgi:c-di-GMP-binding flagellar brake protein YcgR
MTEPEKIQADGVARLIHAMYRDKIPLTLKIAPKRESKPTWVTGIRELPDGRFFAIDASGAGLETTLVDEHWPVVCEFIGRDDVKYVFKTTGRSADNGSVWIQFPDLIERIQRRMLYRLAAPAGTKLFFGIDCHRFELDVKNVSLGGSLGVWASRELSAGAASLLRMNQVVTNLQLVFPTRTTQSAVTIQTARIKRLSKNPVTRGFDCGLEFIEMDKGEERRLTALIYSFQREHLRKRLLLAE